MEVLKVLVDSKLHNYLENKKNEVVILEIIDKIDILIFWCKIIIEEVLLVFHLRDIVHNFDDYYYINFIVN